MFLFSRNKGICEVMSPYMMKLFHDQSQRKNVAGGEDWTHDRLHAKQKCIQPSYYALHGNKDWQVWEILYVYSVKWRQILMSHGERASKY